ncbi:hypothetical protein [Stenotrophomonas sp. S41]|uniref:hypothetical protein n=1 Tax=Stenotrophomonas sp. S41 TaxID=2767464 RepID=UPI001F3AA786|nr:hypothetical protein [Stenotrophomonas sp. S41]
MRSSDLKPLAAEDATKANMDTLSPAQKILLDAAYERRALAEQWLSSDQVTTRLGSRRVGDVHSASQLRRQGKLLGVYVALPLPTYRYPSWQFRPDGQPVDHLAEILTLLREFGPFERESQGLHRTTGWGEIEWFLSPHALLEGASPAAALAEDPASVLSAAQSEFTSGSS